MKPNLPFLYSFLFLFPTFTFSQSNRLTLNGTDYFINGINIPWNSFGTDAGTHHQWGSLYNPDWFEIFFTECENYGVNTARFWVHADGRSTPEFDSDGFIIGLDDNFFENMDDIFAKAETHNVMLILCLWSFDMMKDRTDDAGQFAGIHGDLVRAIEKTVSYIENALNPIVARYSEQCNLLAFEIINEPEWAIDITQGAGTTETATLEEMQRFVGLQAAEIHSLSDKMVTVGSVGLMFNSDVSFAMANFWSDPKISTATSGNPLAFLDFYQIHFWDWMPNFFDPFLMNFESFDLDKPTLIGEFPSKNDGVHTVEFMVNKGFEKGWAGIMPWSYWGMDGAGNWENAKAPLLALRDAHFEEIGFSCTPTSSENQEEGLSAFSIFPNPTKGELYLSESLSEKAVRFQITNSSGFVIYRSKNLSKIDLSDFPKGMYILLFFNKDGALMFTEKVVKFY